MQLGINYLSQFQVTTHCCLFIATIISQITLIIGGQWHLMGIVLRITFMKLISMYWSIVSNQILLKLVPGVPVKSAFVKIMVCRMFTWTSEECTDVYMRHLIILNTHTKCLASAIACQNLSLNEWCITWMPFRVDPVLCVVWNNLAIIKTNRRRQ